MYDHQKSAFVCAVREHDPLSISIAHGGDDQSAKSIATQSQTYSYQTQFRFHRQNDDDDLSTGHIKLVKVGWSLEAFRVQLDEQTPTRRSVELLILFYNVAITSNKVVLTSKWMGITEGIQRGSGKGKLRHEGTFHSSVISSKSL